MPRRVLCDFDNTWNHAGPVAYCSMAQDAAAAESSSTALRARDAAALGIPLTFVEVVLCSTAVDAGATVAVARLAAGQFLGTPSTVTDALYTAPPLVSSASTAPASAASW